MHATHDLQPAQRCAGRAYCTDLPTCGRVEVPIADDTRLGLTARERGQLTVRFQEWVNRVLQTELTALDAIAIVLYGVPGDHERIVGRRQALQGRHGGVREIRMELREVEQ